MKTLVNEQQLLAIANEEIKKLDGYYEGLVLDGVKLLNRTFVFGAKLDGNNKNYIKANQLIESISPLLHEKYELISSENR